MQNGQNGQEFQAPTPEERMQELLEVAKFVKVVEFVPCHGKPTIITSMGSNLVRNNQGIRLEEVQEGMEVDSKKVIRGRQEKNGGAKKGNANHQNNVASLRNTFYHGSFYDNNGVAHRKS